MLLIVDTSRRHATGYEDMFRYMGVLSRVCTPYEALSEISTLYSSVLFTAPHTLPEPWSYMQKFRAYSPGVPCFALTETGEPLAYFDGAISDKCYSSTALLTMQNYCAEHGLRLPGDYRLAGLNVSADGKVPVYFDTEISCTRTECMLVRYLVRAYPHLVQTRDILRYVFRRNRVPEPSCVRCHISQINRKFRAITGRNLIVRPTRAGYVIATPEVLFKEPEEILV